MQTQSQNYTVSRLEQENAKLRARLEKLERALIEAAPETKEMSLEDGINWLVAKNFESTSLVSKLQRTLSTIRDILSDDSETMVGRAKALLNFYLPRKSDTTE